METYTQKNKFSITYVEIKENFGQEMLLQPTPVSYLGRNEGFLAPILFKDVCLTMGEGIFGSLTIFTVKSNGKKNHTVGQRHVTKHIAENKKEKKQQGHLLDTEGMWENHRPHNCCHLRPFMPRRDVGMIFIPDTSICPGCAI